MRGGLLRSVIPGSVSLSRESTAECIDDLFEVQTHGFPTVSMRPLLDYFGHLLTLRVKFCALANVCEAVWTSSGKDMHQHGHVKSLALL